MKKHPIIIIYTTNAYFSFLSNEIGKMARGKIGDRGMEKCGIVGCGRNAFGEEHWFVECGKEKEEKKKFVGEMARSLVRSD